MMFITPQKKGKKEKEDRTWRTHNYICIKSLFFFNLEKENATRIRELMSHHKMNTKI